MASDGMNKISGVSKRMEGMSLGKRGMEEDIMSERVTGLKDLGNGNTTELVGGLSLTKNDSVAADRVKFFHDSVKEGKEVKEVE